MKPEGKEQREGRRIRGKGGATGPLGSVIGSRNAGTVENEVSEEVVLELNLGRVTLLRSREMKGISGQENTPSERQEPIGAFREHSLASKTTDKE